jgi:hypothetical protein
MGPHIRRREQEIRKPTEHEEPIVRVLARVRGREGRGRDGGADAREFADVAAGELDADDVWAFLREFGDERGVEVDAACCAGVWIAASPSPSSSAKLESRIPQQTQTHNYK